MPSSVSTVNPAVQSAGSQAALKSTKNKNDISVNDFFTLLAAQLKNQNMLNPVSDTEFMAQMAQFSALTAMQQLNSTVSNLMAVTYIGKNVTVKTTDIGGNTSIIQGVVEKVEFLSGETFITVEGTKYPISQIAEVTA
ncbi:MAG: flagellar hook capping protein [Clostridiales bacterium]|nr:flagellar hook capping protein [Clostridiales bacterium]